MTEIEIGRGKRGRRAYSFDDIAIVPSRRTRDPEEVSVGWQIDAYHFDIPIIAAPMDSVVSPSSAIALGNLGGLPVLDLEGLWTRYDDPEPLLAEIADITGDAASDLDRVLGHFGPQRRMLGAALRNTSNPTMLEAGYKLNGSLVREGLVDEFLVYLAPKLLGQGQGLANFGPLASLAEAVELEFTSIERVGPDLRVLATVKGRG